MREEGGGREAGRRGQCGAHSARHHPRHSPTLTCACVWVHARTSLTAPVGTMPVERGGKGRSVREREQKARAHAAAQTHGLSPPRSLPRPRQLTPALAVHRPGPGQQGPQHGQHRRRRVQAGQPGGDGQGAVLDNLPPHEQGGRRVAGRHRRGAGQGGGGGGGAQDRGSVCACGPRASGATRARRRGVGAAPTPGEEGEKKKRATGPVVRVPGSSLSLSKKPTSRAGPDAPPRPHA